MSDPAELRKKSRRRIVQENNGDPSLTDLGDGYFALHIQYGGNAVVVNVGTGTEDQAAFREWVEFVVARPDAFQALSVSNTTGGLNVGY